MVLPRLQLASRGKASYAAVARRAAADEAHAGRSGARRVRDEVAAQDSACSRTRGRAADDLGVDGRAVGIERAAAGGGAGEMRRGEHDREHEAGEKSWEGAHGRVLSVAVPW